MIKTTLHSHDMRARNNNKAMDRVNENKYRINSPSRRTLRCDWDAK